MATLDVTELFSDPDLATVFSVVQCAESVSDTGETVRISAAPRPVAGVVQPADAQALSRLPDGSSLAGAITIWTKFPLSAGQIEAGQGADVVLWRGDPYTVIDVSPWVEYGGQRVAVARRATLNPP